MITSLYKYDFFYCFVLCISFFCFGVLVLTGNTGQGTTCLREILLSIVMGGEECSTWWVQTGTSAPGQLPNTATTFWNSPVIFLWCPKFSVRRFPSKSQKSTGVLRKGPPFMRYAENHLKASSFKFGSSLLTLANPEQKISSIACSETAPLCPPCQYW